MSSAKKASLKALKDWVKTSKARALTIAKGTGTPGQRAAPAQTGKNDAKIGSRLDNGETVKKGDREYRRYKWQLNKNAENSTLKRLAAKDSHKVWSQADVEIKKDANAEEAQSLVDEMFEQLEKNMVDE